MFVFIRLKINKIKIQLSPRNNICTNFESAGCVCTLEIGFKWYLHKVLLNVAVESVLKMFFLLLNYVLERSSY